MTVWRDTRNVWNRRRRGDLGPIREWVNEDGERMLGLHPLVLAMSEYYAPGPGQPVADRVAVVSRRLREMMRGERRLPRGVAERTLEVDREQRANGCPDENIAALVTLLREAAK